MTTRSLSAKIFTMSFLALALVTNQACTDDEVLTTVGAVAITGTAVAIGVDGGGYRGRGGGFRGGGERIGGSRGGGGFHGGGGSRGGGGHAGGGGHGGGHGGGRRVDVALDSATTTATDDNQSLSMTQAMSERFNMPEESATQLMQALQSAKSGDTASLVALGVNGQEGKLLANGDMMSDQGLQTLASNLKQDPSDTKEMVQAIMSGAASQKSALCSAARQSSKATTIPDICK